MALYKKRERTQNWTPEEKILLLKLCSSKINILENKKADQYSLTIKTNVWKEIHKEFITKLGSDRDVLRLKEQWQRMKKQARSELQDFKTRSKKNGDTSSQPRKISNLSEEVLKIMEVANKNNSNTEDDDASISSSEISEQDNTPTYFCETEVKQEADDKEFDQENHLKKFYPNIEDSETSLSSLTAVINSQTKLKFGEHKQDALLNIFSNLYQNGQSQSDQQEQENINTNHKKRKTQHHHPDSEEFQLLQSLFECKHKEHQKRMLIIDEQLKTAKTQRETAEIHKQIAQQELKHLLLQSNQRETKKISISANGTREAVKNHKESFDEPLNDEVYHKIHFHQKQIKLHEDEMEKHKQYIEDIIKREH